MSGNTKPAFGVVAVSIGDKPSPWFFNLSEIKASISIPIIDKVETIGLSLKKMRKRVRKSEKDVRVEPLSFALRNDERQILSISRKFAKSGKADRLYKYLIKTIKTSPSIKPGSESRFVNLDKKAFRLINKKEFSKRFKKKHHNLTIDTANLKKNKMLTQELLSQIKPYFNPKQLKIIRGKIRHALPIKVDRELLPTFAKKMVKKFTIYRGPNCFHAALAFQDKSFTNSARYNVKKEKNYHRAMINYDELWRTLKGEFYQVDAAKAPLKYGDVVVFFEVPNKDPGPVNFRWIRHTATYLFGGYTFSKGSKSSNTPYSVKTLKDEWRTWEGYTDLMAVKIFRKSGKNVTKTPAKDLTDWMY